MSKKKLQLVFILSIVILGGVLWSLKKDDEVKVVDVSEQVNVTRLASELLTPNPTQSVTLSEDWQTISNGVSMRAVVYPYNNTQYQLQVVRVDPKQAEFSLHYEKQGKTVQQWIENKENTIMINAGFFKEENAPVGLLFIEGKRLDNHRVALENSGLLQKNGHSVEILNLATTPLPAEKTLQHAVQTYPVLIDHGKVVVQQRLVKQARRTAIGVDKDKNVYLITANYPHLGLYDFAKVLQDSTLSLTKVLNLDGGGSTGIAIKTTNFQKTTNSETPVPTVLQIKLK